MQSKKATRVRKADVLKEREREPGELLFSEAERIITGSFDIRSIMLTHCPPT